jgi:hypothetical protein
MDAGIWAAPLLLIPGVGLLVLSTSTRFGQLLQELHQQKSEGHSDAMKHLIKRAHLLHTALVSFYVSVAVLAFSSLLGTIADRWFESMVWIPQTITFLGVALILFAAIQLIRESKLLISVVLDNARDESITK